MAVDYIAVQTKGWKRANYTLEWCETGRSVLTPDPRAELRADLGTEHAAKAKTITRSDPV